MSERAIESIAVARPRAAGPGVRGVGTVSVTYTPRSTTTHVIAVVGGRRASESTAPHHRVRRRGARRGLS
jgi:hypothetical protein